MSAEPVQVDDVIEQHVEERMALVAHELLSPLSVAKGYAALTVEGLRGNGDAAVLELAVRTSSNLEHATLLLQRLRDSAASADELRLDRAVFDLTELVRRSVDDMAVTVAADHPLTAHLPDLEVCVTGDRTRVRQVLFNLIVNAAKYSDSGEPIEVTLTSDDDGAATVDVRNHGFGVAPEDAERLFQKGARGAGAGAGPTGIGVGLYISRVIAEAHGGELFVEPAEVRGSRFILRLPTS